jgi:hypothetical protein
VKALAIGFLFGFLGFLRADAAANEAGLSPNGQIAVRGDDNPFLVDVGTGRKLAPLLPSWAQGQVSQVSVETHWSSDSHYLAALVFYGSKESLTVVFSVSNHEAILVKFAEPDPETIFKKQMTEKDGSSAAGEPLDSVGPWINNHQLKLSYGVQKDFEDGTSKCFAIDAVLDLSGETGRLESEHHSIYTPQ